MKKLASLKGFNALTSEQLKHINGGGKKDRSRKCETIIIRDEMFGPYNDDRMSPFTCETRCRPSILGIGIGKWSTVEVGPCG